MDNIADIPSKKQPPRGFYDTSREASNSQSAPVGKTLGSMERKGKPADDGEFERRRRNRSQQYKDESQKLKDDAVGERADQIREMKEAQ